MRLRHLHRLVPLYLLLVPIRGQELQSADEAFRAHNWQEAAAAYAALAADEPNVVNCYRLGYSLHALGRLDEALVWHERAAAQSGADAAMAATATYNIACVHALQGRPDDAFATLQLAVQRGFRRAVQLQRDPDLASLRADARFTSLVHGIEDLADLVLVVVHDGVETLDFAGPVEVFAAARDAAGNPAYRVRFVAPQKRPVQPRHWRTRLLPDYGIDDCPQPAIVVVPGGDTGVLDEDPAFIAWLQQTAPGCQRVLSVCTGAFALAEAGLLDGRQATTHHGLRDALARQYPAVEVLAAKVVDSGDVITAGGVSSGIDGALVVVQRQLGEAQATAVAKYIEYAWQPLPATATAAAATPARRAREAAAEPLYRAAVAAATAGGDRSAALAAIEQAVAAGACPARTLLEAAFQPLRTEPRFRDALRAATWGPSTLMVLDDEPGARLDVAGTITDAAGAPVAGALLHVWQTGADGTYANGDMDEANPRLFGFVRTDAHGAFTLRTVRPAAYRGQEGGIEVHVHGQVTTADGRVYVARLGFGDDPFWAHRAAPDWVAPVRTDSDGVQHVAWQIRLDERARR